MRGRLEVAYPVATLLLPLLVAAHAGVAQSFTLGGVVEPRLLLSVLRRALPPAVLVGNFLRLGGRVAQGLLVVFALGRV